MKHVCNRKEISSDKDYFYGEAITEIIYHEEDKVWLASNDEYATVIRYCPFCGSLLRVLKDICDD